MDNVLYGKRLKKARRASGLSQSVAARELDVSLRTWQRWEASADPPKRATVERQAKLLGADAAYLYAGVGGNVIEIPVEVVREPQAEYSTQPAPPGHGELVDLAKAIVDRAPIAEITLRAYIFADAIGDDEVKSMLRQ